MHLQTDASCLLGGSARADAEKAFMIINTGTTASVLHQDDRSKKASSAAQRESCASLRACMTKHLIAMPCGCGTGIG